MLRSRPAALVYGSTSGVYGDCGGARISETRAVRPDTPRAHRRVDAERTVRWLGRTGVAARILRIPGIYAPDREGGTPRERLKKGTPVLRTEDDVYTNHIHADDLARACVAALWRGGPQRVYHASDDSELKMGDYIDLAADLYGLAASAAHRARRSPGAAAAVAIELHGRIAAAGQYAAQARAARAPAPSDRGDGTAARFLTLRSLDTCRPHRSVSTFSCRSPLMPWSEPSMRWLGLIGACAVLAITGAWAALPWLHYIAKPLATLLVAAMVWQEPASERAYRRAVLVGLVLSTAGDVFLMLPGDRFVFGLASFLLAHCAYLVALTRRARFFAAAWPFLAYAALAAMVLALLWPHLPGPLRGPVIAYVGLLTAMAAQAAAAWRLRRDRATALAAAGGLFFVASDAMLAINRFAAPFAAAQPAVLASYWIAQSLIGLSVASGRTASHRRHPDL